MFRLFKRNSKKVFRIVYVLSATIEGNLVHFDLKNMQVVYIQSNDAINAMSRFCMNHATFPHVYIHECKEVKIV